MEKSENETERRETLADIVSELRVLSDKWIADKSMTKTECLGLISHQIADRIEAAAKREVVSKTETTTVGNAAAMREALEPWIAFAEWLLENAGKDRLGEAIRENGPIIRQRMEELRAALSAPPRNCDVGTPEEQVERWQAFCDQFDDDCTGCPCDVATCASYTGCFARWAQTPYEAQEGGAE